MMYFCFLDDFLNDKDLLCVKTFIDGADRVI